MFHVGLAALADLTGGDAYETALVALGESAGWRLARWSVWRAVNTAFWSG